MISLSRIQKQYGKQVLFIDAAFQLNPGEKVGLVGPNGAGKTTLFRLITGEETADEGEISVPRKLTIGYFRQDVEEMSGVRFSTRPSRAAVVSATCTTNWKPCSTTWATRTRPTTWTRSSSASAPSRRSTTTSAATRSKPGARGPPRPRLR
jgi:ATPase subunit of ABC transporter with duplicated ATPase domains